MISANRTVFQTSTAFDSTLKALTLFMISSQSPLRNAPWLAKNQATCQFVSRLPAVELQVDAVTELAVVQVAEDVNHFHSSAEHRESLGQPV